MSYVPLENEGKRVEKKRTDSFLFEKEFKAIDDHIIPFVEPNMQEDDKRLEHLFAPSDVCGNIAWSVLWSVSGFGIFYMLSKIRLINQGEYGVLKDRGTWKLLPPGYQYRPSPLESFEETLDIKKNILKSGTISLIRVQRGQIGLAYDDGMPVILLPGRHLFNKAAFVFKEFKDLKENIEFGPIKFFTVKSGGVQVCYNAGQVQILHPGRYAINSPNFIIDVCVPTQMQNIPFSNHQVMLIGGVNAIVKGLLSYKVESVDKLIHELGPSNLQKNIEDVTEAEITRVFSGVHFEDLSLSLTDKKGHVKEEQKESKNGNTLLGPESAGLKEEKEMNFDLFEMVDIRHWICKQVIDGIRPTVEKWGVKIINFQLLETTLADKKYASQYEEASLAISKAKAAQMTIQTTNDTKLLQAKNDAMMVEIAAEASKKKTITAANAEAESLLILAKAKAEAKLIEAKASNQVGVVIENKFAQTLSLAHLNVEMVKNIQAKTLTVLADSNVGQQVTRVVLPLPQAAE